MEVGGFHGGATGSSPRGRERRRLDEELPERLRLLIEQFEPRDESASAAEDREDEEKMNGNRPQKRGGPVGGA